MKKKEWKKSKKNKKEWKKKEKKQAPQPSNNTAQKRPKNKKAEPNNHPNRIKINKTEELKTIKTN